MITTFSSIVYLTFDAILMMCQTESLEMVATRYEIDAIYERQFRLNEPRAISKRCRKTA